MLKTWGISYKKSKEKAKEIYSKIGRIQCPALNGDYISFNSLGFNHLIRKGRIPRPRNEQKKRFALLFYVEKIIKNPTASIEYKRKETKYYVNRYGSRILITSEADFWTFREKVQDCTIKIVIRQINKGIKKGDKHFFSIMGDDIEIS